MNANREILLGASIAIIGKTIADIGSTATLIRKFPTAQVLDATGCVITPGMINAHQHLTGDLLIRSCIPDLLPPGKSIFEWSIPIHEAHSPDDDDLSARLTAVESLTNGVTTLIEAGTIAHPDRVARSMAEVGIRGTVGTWGWDINEGPYTASASEVLDKQRSVVKAHPPGGLVEGWVTIIGHNLASDELLSGAADLANELGVGLTMHMSPTSSDPSEYLIRTGKRPLAHLKDLGVLGRNLLIAHGVWLDDLEVDLVLDTETAIAYCPWAYLRLGQGVTNKGRHAEIVERGGRVALGCDTSNAGDSQDILRTAALASGIARDSRVDPERFGAHEVFELATITGAEAIGMANRIGSIEIGKMADVVVHDTSTISWIPRGETILNLVWGTDGRSVRDVIVDGRLVVRDGACTTVNLAELRLEATEAQTALLLKSGIQIPHRWPHIPMP